MGWTVFALWVGPFLLYGLDRFCHLVQGLSRPLPAAHRKVPRAFTATRGTHLTHSLVQDWGHTLPHHRRT